MKNIFSYFKKPDSNLKLVYESDLENYLSRLGIADELDGGGLTCVFCGKKVSRDNLSALLPKNGEVKVVCDKAVCIRKMESDKL